MFGANITFGAILSFDAVCVDSPVIIILQEKVTNKYKGKFNLIRDHRKNVGKQGRSPTPVDILVDI